MEPKTSDTAGELSGHGVRLIRDQVLVRQDPPAEKLSSGLYAPPTAARELQDDFGTVVGIGPGLQRPGDFAVGDRVLFKRRPGSALIPDRREGGPAAWENLLRLKEEDIMCVVDPD